MTEQQLTTRQLIDGTTPRIDRSDWARRGHPDFAGYKLLAVEVIGGNLDAAAETLDDHAKAYDSVIDAVQNVRRRGKHVIYARVK